MTDIDQIAMPLEKAMNGLGVGEAATQTAVVSITDDPRASAQSPGHDSPASVCGLESSGREWLAPTVADAVAVEAHEGDKEGDRLQGVRGSAAEGRAGRDLVGRGGGEG